MDISIFSEWHVLKQFVFTEGDCRILYINAQHALGILDVTTAQDNNDDDDFFL